MVTFTNHTSVSGICKDLLKFNNKETNNPCEIAKVVEQKFHQNSSRAGNHIYVCLASFVTSPKQTRATRRYQWCLFENGYICWLGCLRCELLKCCWGESRFEQLSWKPIWYFFLFFNFKLSYCHIIDLDHGCSSFMSSEILPTFPSFQLLKLTTTKLNMTTLGFSSSIHRYSHDRDIKICVSMKICPRCSKQTALQ